MKAGRDKAKRRPGYLKGKIKVSEDFDAPLPDEVMEAFAGESPGEMIKDRAKDSDICRK